MIGKVAVLQLIRCGREGIAFCEMIIRSRKSSRQVITTKNNQDSLDSATAPHIAIYPILKPSGGP
jgi:hypothetical protein